MFLWIRRLLSPSDPPFVLGDGMNVWSMLSGGIGARSPRQEILHECHKELGMLEDAKDLTNAMDDSRIHTLRQRRSLSNAIREEERTRIHPKGLDFEHAIAASYSKEQRDLS